MLRRMQLGARALLLAVGLSTAGCYTLDVRVGDIMTDDVAKGAYIKSFHVEIKCHHLINGLVTLGNPEIKAAIEREVRGANGRYARNLRLTHQRSFVDGLLGGITYSIYTPTTVLIDGDIVK